MDAATGIRKRVTRPQPEPASSRPPIQYRLPKPEDLGKIEKEEEEDYTPLVLAASHAALSLFVTQAISSVLLANYFDAVIEIRFVWSVVPYLSLAVAKQGDLVAIVSYSTALSVLAVCFGTLQSLVRHRTDLHSLYGWSSGLAMGSLLLAFQFLRHYLNPPVIDTQVLAQAAAFLAAALVLFVGFKPQPDAIKNHKLINQLQRRKETT